MTEDESSRGDFSDVVKEKIAFEDRPENRIHVDYTPVKWHSLVRHTRSVLRKMKPDDYGRVHAYEPGCLDIRVGRESIDRALCIMNALIDAVEARGGRVFIDKPGQFTKQQTFVEILGEKIAISIEEPSKQVKHVLTAKEIQDKARYTFSSAPKFDHIPSGLLELKINTWCSGIHLRVRDGVHKRIDGSMNQFMISLLQCAEQMRDNRIEQDRAEKDREEQERRYWEMKRKQEAEEKELAKALTEAENWSKAHLLRQYRHAAAEAYVRKFGLIPSESDFSKWSSRITEMADKLDPLCA